VSDAGGIALVQNLLRLECCLGKSKLDCKLAMQWALVEDGNPVALPLGGSPDCISRDDCHRPKGEETARTEEGPSDDEAGGH
jgi:hypothetical protein